MMTFIKEVENRGILVPYAAFALSEMGDAENIELRTMDNVMVLQRSEMTAGQALAVAECLMDFATELLMRVVESCNSCMGCGDRCPYEGGVELEVPDYLRACADIPANAKLCAVADPDEGTITVKMANDRSDLSSVPGWILSLMGGYGVCLDSLDDLLAGNTVVYGNKQ